MSLPRIFLALSVLALIVSLNVSFGGLFAQAANSGRSTLAGSAPTWANSKNYQSAANPTIDVGFRVYLGWNNPSAVEALAGAVSNPKSPSYGQYLTPQQFRQQFAPSQSQAGAAQSWLKSQGFTVAITPMNNHYVSQDGTVAQTQHLRSSKILISGRPIAGFRHLQQANWSRLSHPELTTIPRRGSHRIRRDGMARRRLTWKLFTGWRPLRPLFSLARPTTSKTST